MFIHPTIDKLKTLRLHGMANALSQQLQQPDSSHVSLEDCLALMVEEEMMLRDNRRLQTRLKKAKLKQLASMEDIDYQVPRGLDKALMLELANCQ